MARFVVVEGDGPALEAHVAAALEAAADDGRAVAPGWSTRATPGACTGVVATAEDARSALRAALGGAALVVRATADRDTIDRFLDDLRRLGPVEHVTADATPPARLDREQRALLALLAEGFTLGNAACELALSRRTADRRLAAARRILGVATTAEAILASRRPNAAVVAAAEGLLEWPASSQPRRT